jgi:hypothetical protein
LTGTTHTASHARAKDWRRADFWAYLIAASLIVLIIGLLLFYELVYDKLTAGTLEKLGEPHKTAVNMMLDLSKSFAGWAVGLIGATTLIVKSAIEKPGELNRPQIAFTFAILTAAVVSIFFSQLAAERIYELIFVDQVVQRDARLLLFLRNQYLFGLGGIAGFAFLLFQLAWSKLSHAQH